MSNLFWLTTHAMITKRSGDRTNVAFVIRAPHRDVPALLDELNAGRIVLVEKLETRATDAGRRCIMAARQMGLAASAVASLEHFNGELDGVCG